jgi:hypothetical protein
MPSTYLHAQVGQHQVEFAFFQLLQGLDAAVHGDDVVPFFLQHMLQILPGDEFVIDNQDPGRLHTKGHLIGSRMGLQGRRIINRVPSPSLLSTVMVP